LATIITELKIMEATDTTTSIATDTTTMPGIGIVTEIGSGTETMEEGVTIVIANGQEIAIGRE
jgi:hypothetical protein